MFVFYMRSKLDLCLKASKFTSLLKGDRMGAIQNVITSLEETNKDVSETPRQLIHLKFLESLNTASNTSSSF